MKTEYISLVFFSLVLCIGKCTFESIDKLSDEKDISSILKNTLSE